MERNEGHRYRVKVGTADSGFYQQRVRAENPVDALLKVARRLGLPETPSSPFVIFVTPILPGS